LRDRRRVVLNVLARPSLQWGVVDCRVWPPERSLSVWSACALSKLNRKPTFCEAEIKSEFERYLTCFRPSIFPFRRERFRCTEIVEFCSFEADRRRMLCALPEACLLQFSFCGRGAPVGTYYLRGLMACRSLCRTLEFLTIAFHRRFQIFRTERREGLH
jgi:hypothetical protein